MKFLPADFARIPVIILCSYFLAAPLMAYDEDFDFDDEQQQQGYEHDGSYEIQTDYFKASQPIYAEPEDEDDTYGDMEDDEESDEGEMPVEEEYDQGLDED